MTAEKYLREIISYTKKYISVLHAYRADTRDPNSVDELIRAAERDLKTFETIKLPRELPNDKMKALIETWSSIQQSIKDAETAHEHAIRRKRIAALG